MDFDADSTSEFTMGCGFHANCGVDLKSTMKKKKKKSPVTSEAESRWILRRVAETPAKSTSVVEFPTSHPQGEHRLQRVPGCFGPVQIWGGGGGAAMAVRHR